MRTPDRRAIKRGGLIAAVIGAGLAAEILLGNVVRPPVTDDDGVAVVVSYLCVLAAMFLAGLLAARDGAGRAGQALAGLTVGVLIGVLIIATFVIVDNVWLDVVARQQAKIDGFAHSGAASMRAYLNHALIGPGLFFTAGFGAVGAILGGLGGLAGQPPRATATVGPSR
ncbi:hypothetical protein [Actinoplanes sp. NPDC026623]|uniref:hypothetical protein n=1 Tax=Actinoplanes sp. NPDC026623 TaxID=3155610 RepID=UPI00340A2E39